MSAYRHNAKQLALTVCGMENIPVNVLESQYEHGGLAVQLVLAQDWQDLMNDEVGRAGEVVATLSVWLPDTLALPAGAFYFKTWSENEGLFSQLVAAGVIVPCASARPVCVGFGCTAYPCFLSWTRPEVGNAQYFDILAKLQTASNN